MINELLNELLIEAETKSPEFNFKQEEEKKRNAEKIAREFVQELLTTFYPPLKPNYGTTFIQDLGEVINPYKFQYYLEQNANKLIDKYNITSIEIEDINVDNNMLIGKLILHIDNIKTTAQIEIDWNNKFFTTEPLVE